MKTYRCESDADIAMGVVDWLRDEREYCEEVLDTFPEDHEMVGRQATCRELLGVLEKVETMKEFRDFVIESRLFARSRRQWFIDRVDGEVALYRDVVGLLRDMGV